MTNINDHHFLKDYFQLLRQASDFSEEYEQKLIQVKDLWLLTKKTGGKIIFVGNGGSAGIASHLAIDLSKNGGIRAVCFNDASLITCLANDYGYEDWLRSAIKIYADKRDVLVAISSSGSSKNILMGVKEARRKDMKIVTLSGFSSNNPLRLMGDINMWLDSKAYNIIETVHQFWMMSVIDLIIGSPEYPSNMELTD